MKIEVFYSMRCAKCHLIEHVVHTALEELGMDEVVHKVTNEQEAMNRGAMSQPVLWINGELKTQGRVPLVSEVKEIIETERQAGVAAQA
jgi:small redox-active disulfide protein 2